MSISLGRGCWAETANVVVVCLLLGCANAVFCRTTSQGILLLPENIRIGIRCREAESVSTLLGYKCMRYLLILLFACRLPHVNPELRAPWAQWGTDVRVESSCDEFGNSGTSSGVIISERHVLTAAHSVGCSALPDVHVYLQDGRRLRMVVERDDLLFGNGADIARLEIASAEYFDLGIAPPVLGTLEVGDTVCLAAGCGRVSPYEAGLVEVPSEPGDSGRGVYDWYGRLLGIVVRTDGHWTRIEPVSAYWLEGT